MKTVLTTLLCLTVVRPALPQDDDEFQYPLAVTTTADGTVFVADRNLPGIWEIRDGKKTVYFRGSKQFRTPLNAVRCLAIDHEGRLLAGDSSTREVYRFGEDGQPAPLTAGWIGIPMSIAVAPDGTIYTADLELHRIWKMPAQGSEMPEEFAVINSPRGLTLDADGNLWVLSTSSKNGQIQKVAPDGTIHPYVKDHPFRLPHKIVWTTDGTFFVTDNYSQCVWKISPDATPGKWVEGAPLDRPVGLCLYGDGLLVTDPHIKTVFVVTAEQQVNVFSGPAAATSQ